MTQSLSDIRKQLGGSERIDEEYRKKIDVNLDRILGELEREGNLDSPVSGFLFPCGGQGVFDKLQQEYKGFNCTGTYGSFGIFHSPAEHLYEIIKRDDVAYIQGSVQYKPMSENAVFPSTEALYTGGNKND